MITTTDPGGLLCASRAELLSQALHALATAEGLLMGISLNTDFTSGIETDRVESVAYAAHAWAHVAETYAGLM